MAWFPTIELSIRTSVGTKVSRYTKALVIIFGSILCQQMICIHGNQTNQTRNSIKEKSVLVYYWRRSRLTLRRNGSFDGEELDVMDRCKKNGDTGIMLFFEIETDLAAGEFDKTRLFGLYILTASRTLPDQTN